MKELLIVDDEKIIRDRLTRLIDWESIGFHVANTFSCGNESIEYLKEHHIDAVFTDVVMDDGTGIELAEWINAYQPEICVVLLTGYADFETARRAISLPVVKNMIMKPSQPSEIRHVFSQILGELILREGAYSEEKSPSYDPFTEKVSKYVQNHLSEDVFLSDLAAEMHFSISYLSKLIKERTGRNFTDWLIGIRIEKAKELLRTTNLPVSIIGSNVGYSDARHFARLFRKHSGISPNEYRRKTSSEE